MEFDLNKFNGTLGLYLLGMSLISYLDFMISSILDDFLGAVLTAVAGSIFLIAGAIFMWLNTKEVEEGYSNPSSGTIRVFFFGTIILDVVCMIIGSVFLL